MKNWNVSVIDLPRKRHLIKRKSYQFWMLISSRLHIYFLLLYLNLFPTVLFSFCWFLLVSFVDFKSKLYDPKFVMLLNDATKYYKWNRIELQRKCILPFKSSNLTKVHIKRSCFVRTFLLYQSINPNKANNSTAIHIKESDGRGL